MKRKPLARLEDAFNRWGQQPATIWFVLFAGATWLLALVVLLAIYAGGTGPR